MSQKQQPAKAATLSMTEQMQLQIELLSYSGVRRPSERDMERYRRAAALVQTPSGAK